MHTSIKEKKAPGLKAPIPQDITSRVGKEILREEFEPSVWARSLATVKGDHDAIIAEYARLRISQLVRSRTTAKIKTDSLEQRRLNACLGVKTVRDILDGVGRVGVENVPRPKAPWIWMLLLALGLAGCTSTGIRILMGEVPEGLWLVLPLISLGVGVASVLLLILISQFFSRGFIAWAWGPGIVGLSSVFCLASLLLGTKLMVNNPYRPMVTNGPAIEQAGDWSDNGRPTVWQDGNGKGMARPVTVSAGIAIAE